MLTHRLGPKGTWPSSGAPNSPGADDEPPAERRDLTHSGTHSERGKPVVLPKPMLLSHTEVEVKGKRAVRRAHGTAGMGDGKSEGRSVMDRIEVELRQHHLRRKQADFHLVSAHERV